LVPKTVQIRDIGDEVYAALERLPPLLLQTLDKCRGDWPDAGR